MSTYNHVSTIANMLGLYISATILNVSQVLCMNLALQNKRMSF